ncbi:MAG: hypothetical protein RLZ97_412, partial [Verrucomicrobiota bacterium]
KAMGKAADADLKGVKLGQIDVPPWVVKERLDLEGVSSFALESHHGVPKKVQEWLGLTKDQDSVPAYLTTMLEHRGAEVGIHQRLAEKMGAKIGTGPVNLNQMKPQQFVGQEHLIVEALEETYTEMGLGHFWEVCEHWIGVP